MPSSFAELTLETLRIVNQLLDTWVSLGSEQPLTSMGLELVGSLADVAVAVSFVLSQLLANSPFV
ncbi:MAG: hypothetical protein IBX68_04580 [Dehalococcoidia bacterium]|nr:hypothetical protein [Dehalococcoidia bacterium]